MAGFNIRDFSSHMNANGLMRNNKFLVRMPYPQGFDSVANLKESARYMELWCDSAALPGISIRTADVRRQGYGPIEKMGVAPVFNNVQMTFISDRNAKVHEFFYNWTKIIANHDVRNGDFNSTATGVPTSVRQKPYELSYKNTYVSDVEVTVFNENSNPTMKVVLRSAYPTTVGDVQLNWNDTGDFVRIPISFTFTDYYTEYYNR